MTAKVGVRWTVGDVSDRGWETLRLSIWGARKTFGSQTRYAVCVNSIPLDAARRRVGAMPEGLIWHDSTGQVPGFLKAHFDPAMAEGVGWKFAPLRIFPDRFELALDNDCILWEMPAAVTEWLDRPDAGRCVIAEDVKPCFGQFAPFCGPQPRNSGIRGLPPGFDLERSLRGMLAEAARQKGSPVVMTSETDEQGLQMAALQRDGSPLVVTVDEVTICSPFWPHIPRLGRCGAHFVGINGRHIAWDYYGRPADEWSWEFWQRHRPELYERVGLSLPLQGELPIFPPSQGGPMGGAQTAGRHPRTAAASALALAEPAAPIAEQELE